jgi:NitT/TauT family transport system permease protein
MASWIARSSSIDRGFQISRQLGLGITSKIVIVFLAAFFPVAINMYSGVRNVSGGLIEYALAEGAREPQVFGKIIIPASLPFTMTGIRLAMGRAVVGMVAGEVHRRIRSRSCQRGLRKCIRDRQVVCGNYYLALLGVSLTEVVKIAERRFAPWKQTERAN